MNIRLYKCANIWRAIAQSDARAYYAEAMTGPDALRRLADKIGGVANEALREAAE